MQSPGAPSLDQLHVFLTVVDVGSFSAAGRKLNRATSAISYAIANLEQQLGVQLFDRDSARTPVLTEAGLAVLTEARTVAWGVDTLRAKVKGMLGGVEAEVSLAVDVMFPTERLVDAMRGFEIEFPSVSLRLHVEALGAVTQLLLDGIASIGVAGPAFRTFPGLEQVGVGGVQMTPVAAPSHPLAQGPNAAGAVRNHVQLVLTDRSPLTEGHDFGVFSLRTWRLADLGAKHALLLAGVGWGGMPEPLVRADLALGRLSRLDLAEWSGGSYPFRAIYRADAPPGPAAGWLIRRFGAQAAQDASDPQAGL